MSINRQQACDLFKYDFKLVDKEGQKFGITGVIDSRIFIYGSHVAMDTAIFFKDIGETHFILARHLSNLTDELSIDGEGFKPIEKLGHIIDWNYGYERIECWKIEQMLKWHFLPHGIEEGNVKYINY